MVAKEDHAIMVSVLASNFVHRLLLHCLEYGMHSRGEYVYSNRLLTLPNGQVYVWKEKWSGSFKASPIDHRYACMVCIACTIADPSWCSSFPGTRKRRQTRSLRRTTPRCCPESNTEE